MITFLLTCSFFQFVFCVHSKIFAAVFTSVRSSAASRVLSGKQPKNSYEQNARRMSVYGKKQPTLLDRLVTPCGGKPCLSFLSTNKKQPKDVPQPLPTPSSGSSIYLPADGNMDVEAGNLQSMRRLQAALQAQQAMMPLTRQESPADDTDVDDMQPSMKKPSTGAGVLPVDANELAGIPF